MVLLAISRSVVVFHCVSARRRLDSSVGTTIVLRSRIIAITFVLRFIWTFNWFDLTYLLTGGGPGTATMTLPIQVYITAFRTYQLGLSAAYATIIAVVLLVLTVVFLRLTSSGERA